MLAYYLIPIILTSLISGTTHADSLDGIVSRYTKDCPMKVASTISLRYKKGFETIEEATEYSEDFEDRIKNILSKNNINNVHFSLNNASIDKRTENRLGEKVEFWVASGNVNIKLDDVDAINAIKILDAENYEHVSMRRNSHTPSSCKK